ncbi:hypothetical protein BN2475_480063 [Paraburkholderia ribeironis]|uniref:Uncharacterized protein n=1 Tax=Paraburkholderia ribeironis TaxID=1247936 RepID=A0A1N7SCG5_9BURK|nr:hypothetical protein BN2475_480063 [Paraburkholderia ribeironis]
MPLCRFADTQTLVPVRSLQVVFLVLTLASANVGCRCMWMGSLDPQRTFRFAKSGRSTY